MMKKENLFKKILSLALFVTVAFVGVRAYCASETLRFVQISDVHLSDMKFDTGYRVVTNSRELLSDAVKQINLMPNLDFVFVTGDMTNSPNTEMIEEFDAKMNTLKMPWYSVFGNHDIAIRGEITKEKYVEILKKNNKNYKFEKEYYSFSPKKGFRVLALYSIIDDEITANGRISKEQLQWLDTELAKAKKNGEIPLIFLHNPLHPPFPTFSGALSKLNHELRNPQEFYAILKKYEMPMAIFSGHYHATKIYKEGNILHVSTPAMVCYPNAFRFITVTNTKNKVIFNLAFKETRLKDVQTKAKNLAPRPEKLSGTEPDRNAVIEIDK